MLAFEDLLTPCPNHDVSINTVGKKFGLEPSETMWPLTKRPVVEQRCFPGPGIGSRQWPCGCAQATCVSVQRAVYSNHSGIGRSSPVVGAPGINHGGNPMFVYCIREVVQGKFKSLPLRAYCPFLYCLRSG